MKTEIHKKLSQATFLIMWRWLKMNHLCWVISKPELSTESSSWLLGLGKVAHGAEPLKLPYFPPISLIDPADPESPPQYVNRQNFISIQGPLSLYYIQ